MRSMMVNPEDSLDRTEPGGALENLVALLVGDSEVRTDLPLMQPLLVEIALGVIVPVHYAE